MSTSHTPPQLNSLHLYPPLPAPQIFTYGTSEPTALLHSPSEESVTPKGDPKLCNNPPNLVQSVIADPYSDPISSCSSLSDSSDLSDNDHSKQIKRTKNSKKEAAE